MQLIIRSEAHGSFKSVFTFSLDYLRTSKTQYRKWINYAALLFIVANRIRISMKNQLNVKLSLIFHMHGDTRWTIHVKLFNTTENCSLIIAVVDASSVCKCLCALNSSQSLAIKCIVKIVLDFMPPNCSRLQRRQRGELDKCVNSWWQHAAQLTTWKSAPWISYILPHWRLAKSLLFCHLINCGSSDDSS